MVSSPRARKPVTTPARSGFRAVLADLPLAFDAGDRNLDADDALHLRHHVIGRRVVDLPRIGQAALARIRQVLDLAPQPGVVAVHDARAAPDVHGDVVPGRHDLAGLLLGRVPGRRDVVLRALEHRQAFLDLRQLAPLRIAARHVAAQRAVRRAVGIDQERDRIGHQPARTGGDQHAERMGADQGVLNLDPVLAKGGWLIHWAGPSLGREWRDA